MNTIVSEDTLRYSLARMDPTASSLLVASSALLLLIGVGGLLHTAYEVLAPR